jgi:hypothetical protein
MPDGRNGKGKGPFRQVTVSLRSISYHGCFRANLAPTREGAGGFGGLSGVPSHRCQHWRHPLTPSTTPALDSEKKQGRHHSVRPAHYQTYRETQSQANMDPEPTSKLSAIFSISLWHKEMIDG